MAQIPTNQLIQEQISYYQARASEYDEWFLRQGRYDQGELLNQQWFTEVNQVRSALQQANPSGHILEIACGTGLWSEQLLPFAERLTAVDASPEMIMLNKQRLISEKAEYIQTNIFEWQPAMQYDFIFFGFWLSHVPPNLFQPFWQLLKTAIRPGGQLFFVDSLYTQSSTAHDHKLGQQTDLTLKRRLNDGREFEIVKIFYEPATLTQQLADLGWHVTVNHTDNYFLYGQSA